MTLPGASDRFNHYQADSTPSFSDSGSNTYRNRASHDRTKMETRLAGPSLIVECGSGGDGPVSRRKAELASVWGTLFGKSRFERPILFRSNQLGDDTASLIRWFPKLHDPKNV